MRDTGLMRIRLSKSKITYIVLIKVINSDSYQYLILFDNSNGHDRTATDALKANTIHKLYGRKQPAMCYTTTFDKSFLSPSNHNRKLSVGDIQKFVIYIHRLQALFPISRRKGKETV